MYGLFLVEFQKTNLINAGDLAVLTILLQSDLHPFNVLHTRRRNINLLSIVYALRPRLRNRLTLGGITFPRKP